MSYNSENSIQKGHSLQYQSICKNAKFIWTQISMFMCKDRTSQDTFCCSNKQHQAQWLYTTHDYFKCYKSKEDEHRVLVTVGTYSGIQADVACL